MCTLSYPFGAFQYYWYDHPNELDLEVVEVAVGAGL